MAKVEMPFMLQKPTGAQDAFTLRQRIAQARGLQLGQNGLTLKVFWNHQTGQVIVSYDDSDAILNGKGIGQGTGQGIINAIVRQWSEYISG